eukprot:PhF_6_TR14749/c0_g1_i1/m.23161/K04353/RAP1A; Ras-related protein Rap-1A
MTTIPGVEQRIVVLGAGGVGKSCLCIQFIQGHFVKKYDPTVEDSYRKQIDVDGTPHMIEVLDTAGQDQYASMRETYMKSGNGFVIVYSIADPSTLQSAIKIHDQLLKVRASQPDTPCILLGNKADLLHERQVDATEGEALAKSWGCDFCETSALFRKSPPKDTSPPHMHHITGAEDAFMKLLRRLVGAPDVPAMESNPHSDSNGNGVQASQERQASNPPTTTGQSTHRRPSVVERPPHVVPVKKKKSKGWCSIL